MTRKHFTAIAKLCNAQKKQFKSDRAYAEFCIQMGETIKEFNNDFSMNRFLEACHDGYKPITAKDLI